MSYSTSMISTAILVFFPFSHLTTSPTLNRGLGRSELPITAFISSSSTSASSSLSEKEGKSGSLLFTFSSAFFRFSLSASLRSRSFSSSRSFAHFNFFLFISSNAILLFSLIFFSSSSSSFSIAASLSTNESSRVPLILSSSCPSCFCISLNIFTCFTILSKKRLRYFKSVVDVGTGGDM